MESKLCMNCFAGFDPEESGTRCPVCGWDNAKPQIPEGLEFHTTLASRYVIGRAKAMNGEGITYSALDSATKKLVEVREFFPVSLVTRHESGAVQPVPGAEGAFEEFLSEFIEYSKGVSRLRELTVVTTVLDIFDENYTAYAVYEYEPTLSLRRYVERQGGSLEWNRANQLFQPVLTAMGLMNSLGISHLGISPETLRVTRDGSLMITGFCIHDARQAGGPIVEELFPGCAGIEQYSERAVCGEVTDVYAVAATMLFAVSGKTPAPAPKRLEDPRLLIPREILKSLPPFAVTAIANALQVKQAGRTGSFERFRSELAAAPTLVNEMDQTDAIRRLPPIELDLPRNKGLPPLVWLIGSCAVTLIALFIVASMWLGDQGMSFTDIGRLFEESSAAAMTTQVPNMVNQSFEEWQKRIAAGEYDFDLKVSTREFSSTVDEGNIISQSPFADEPLEPGGTVLVTVSKGSATRTLPEIKGMSFADLQAVLTQDGFVPVKQEEHSEDLEAGYVIRYLDHAEGDALDYGATVTVVVSAGPEGA